MVYSHEHLKDVAEATDIIFGTYPDDDGSKKAKIIKGRKFHDAAEASGVAFEADTAVLSFEDKAEFLEAERHFSELAGAPDSKEVNSDWANRILLQCALGDAGYELR